MTTASKEIAKSTRTLICLLQSLIDHRVLIELRNDHFVLVCIWILFESYSDRNLFFPLHANIGYVTISRLLYEL